MAYESHCRKCGTGLIQGDCPLCGGTSWEHTYLRPAKVDVVAPDQKVARCKKCNMTLTDYAPGEDLCGACADDVSKQATHDMRVWWIPQIPGQPFYVPVNNENEAILILKTLADYDKFQFDNRIKGDYANAGGLEVKLDDGWEEWTDNDGDIINEVIKAKKAPWIK
jgi:hypothetical protein